MFNHGGNQLAIAQAFIIESVFPVGGFISPHQLPGLHLEQLQNPAQLPAGGWIGKVLDDFRFDAPITEQRERGPRLRAARIVENGHFRDCPAR